MTKTIAVLMGGWSLERDVSLTSGKAVSASLKAKGYTVKEIDVSKDLSALVKALTPRPDVVFNALHGTGGEDGTIQAILDMLEIPYTHSNVKTSAIAMDKNLTRQIAMSNGISVAPGMIIESKSLLSAHPMTPPYVAKPIADGSTMGIKIIFDTSETYTQKDIDLLGEKALIEKFIPGRELTVGLIGGKALAITEITYPSKTYFDYEAKYTAGFAEHILPANLPEEITKKLLADSETIYAALGCNGISRCDYRYDESDPTGTKVYFLEINTQPGFTPISLLPEQAASKGMSFVDVVEYLINHPVASAHSKSSESLKKAG